MINGLSVKGVQTIEQIYTEKAELVLLYRKKRHTLGNIAMSATNARVPFNLMSIWLCS